MAAYYNELDPYAAQWLRNLIAAGHIAPGDVDERDIRDVHPDDLRPYTQCHFFAGIGIWSYALRQAGWPDDKPVWTGSCPCQPFSAAGQGEGFTDERHLWPAWHYLIEQCRPIHIFGEQVASKDGLGWLDLVQADLEGAHYASWPVDLCAAGIGSPNIRQRLWFVAERLADTTSAGLELIGRCGMHSSREAGTHLNDLKSTGGVGNANATGLQEPSRVPGNGGGPHGSTSRQAAVRAGGTGGVAIAEGVSSGTGLRSGESPKGRGVQLGDSCGDDQPSPTNGFWRDVDWLSCRDGKWRPVRPGSFPLAHGATARVGRLCAYGNAINAEVAKTFIAAYMHQTA